MGLALSLAEHLGARQGIGPSGPDRRSVGGQVKANPERVNDIETPTVGI